jgi:hypothetical protein
MNASPAGIHTSTVYRGPISCPPLPTVSSPSQCLGQPAPGSASSDPGRGTPSLVPSGTFGLCHGIGFSGEKIESSQASEPVSSTEDNHGAGGVPISGPSRSTCRGHPRMRRLSLVLATHISGMVLAIINKSVRKKGTPSDRVGLDLDAFDNWLTPYAAAQSYAWIGRWSLPPAGIPSPP